jgi:DNA replication and repair protein RecF
MLKSISLFAFRNYLREDVPLDPGINLFLGANAQGKTNLLEAIYFACTGRSPRAAVLLDLVMWDQAGARVALELDEGDTVRMLELRLEREKTGTRAKRSATLDGKKASATSVAGRVPAVIFHPEEMTLLRGAGEGRRRLLNGLLSQLEPGYAALLSRYGRVQEQRNQLLKRIGEGAEGVAALEWWTEEIGKLGDDITARRRRWLTELAPVVARRHEEVAPEEQMSLRYAPNVDDAGGGRLADELRGRLSEELARGVTVAGPHRDDLVFEISGLPAAAHASQGQQRTAILAFKLAELELLAGAGRIPILLLDDVMSELDAPRREHLLGLVESTPQVVITTAEARYFPDGFLDRVKPRRVVAGKLVGAEGSPDE